MNEFVLFIVFTCDSVGASVWLATETSWHVVDVASCVPRANASLLRPRSVSDAGVCVFGLSCLLLLGGEAIEVDETTRRNEAAIDIWRPGGHATIEVFHRICAIRS
jgi:hypothetical protein